MSEGFTPKRWVFFASCVPPKTTSQQKGAHATADGGVRFFKKAKTITASNTLEAVLLPHKPSQPMAGIVSLSVEVVWPWRASDVKTRTQQERADRYGRIRSGVKPDCDNFVKMLQDALVSLRFIEGDELVSDLRVRKFFGENPGITIELTQLDEVEIPQ